MARGGAFFTHARPGGVGVEVGVAHKGRLRTEEDDQRQHGGAEDGDEVERPLPTNRTRHLAHNHRREERSSKQTQIAQRHPLASLMNEVQIPHAGIDQGLERRQRNALEEPRRHERFEVVVAPTAPCRADDDEDGSEDV